MCELCDSAYDDYYTDEERQQLLARIIEVERVLRANAIEFEELFDTLEEANTCDDYELDAHMADLTEQQEDYNDINLGC